MPAPPEQFSSVMERSRPVPASDNVDSKVGSGNPIVISMKTSYSPEAEVEADTQAEPENGAMMQMAGLIDERASILSSSKALPPAPPELSAVNDRVAFLNARLGSLANRRVNINRSIKQMTELMPTDNLMASAEVLRKREVEKQKVEVLKQELSEVQQEEYELGIKLHRAYKRLDKDGEWEPTTLWVRRVTK
jgi:hypothetical protein